MKWVLNTYQTAQNWEVDRIIQVCQAAGYEGIEFLQDFQQKHGLTYPILLDETGTVANAYRVQGFPTNVIIDRQGRLRYIEPGFNAEAVNRTLQQLLAP